MKTLHLKHPTIAEQVSGYTSWFGKDSELFPATTHGVSDMDDFEARFMANADVAEFDAKAPGCLFGTYQGHPISVKLQGSPIALNQVVFGCAGSGKTYHYLAPNLAQANCSYIVADKAGELYEEFAPFFARMGYRVFKFDATGRGSNVYNPLDYVYDADGTVSIHAVTHLVNRIDKYVSRDEGDPFWQKSAKACLTFAILYVMEMMPVERRNLYEVYSLLTLAQNTNGAGTNQLDLLAEVARRQNPNAKCLPFYDTFAIAPEKTRAAVVSLICCALAWISKQSFRALTTTSYVCTRTKNGQVDQYITDAQGKLIRDHHNLDLTTLGLQRDILFITLPHTMDDPAVEILYSLLVMQITQILPQTAENQKMKWKINNIWHRSLQAGFESEQDATSVQKFYAQAQARTITVDGLDRYYICNPNADVSLLLPEASLISELQTQGCLQEVCDFETAERIIDQYRHSTIQQQMSGSLPVHMRLILDQCLFPMMHFSVEHVLACMRHENMSLTLIFQSIVQFDYGIQCAFEDTIGCAKDNIQLGRTWLAHFDILVYLGSPDIVDTNAFVSSQLGNTLVPKETNTNKVHKRKSNMNVLSQYQVQPLLSKSELMLMPDDDAIVAIRTCKPMKLTKLSFHEHPAYMATGYGNTSNIASAERWAPYFMRLFALPNPCVASNDPYTQARATHIPVSEADTKEVQKTLSEHGILAADDDELAYEKGKQAVEKFMKLCTDDDCNEPSKRFAGYNTTHSNESGRQNRYRCKNVLCPKHPDHQISQVELAKFLKLDNSKTATKEQILEAVRAILSQD